MITFPKTKYAFVITAMDKYEGQDLEHYVGTQIHTELLKTTEGPEPMESARIVAIPEDNVMITTQIRRGLRSLQKLLKKDEHARAALTCIQEALYISARKRGAYAAGKQIQEMVKNMRFNG